MAFFENPNAFCDTQIRDLCFDAFFNTALDIKLTSCYFKPTTL